MAVNLVASIGRGVVRNKAHSASGKAEDKDRKE